MGARATPATGGARRWQLQHSLVAMVATLALVTLGDLTIGSWMTGKLRVWFPVWIDPAWEAAGSKIVYSQSYIAGIALILPFLRAIERELVWLGSAQRALYWAVGGATFCFIIWWKGGLMREFGKEREAALWAALGAVGYLALDRRPIFPRALVEVELRVFLARFAYALSKFFLGMAFVDPLLQVRLHGLEWSTGLLIEVGFFVPAGLALKSVAHRLESRRTD